MEFVGALFAILLLPSCLDKPWREIYCDTKREEEREREKERKREGEREREKEREIAHLGGKRSEESHPLSWLKYDVCRRLLQCWW